MCISMNEIRRLSVSIDRPAAEAYEFLAVPENFPKWAAGLGTSLKPAGMDYFVDTPEGLAQVQFSDRNRFGILDHRVTLPGGRSIYVPLRVVSSGNGCALTLTLFRRPEASDAEFEADAQWVMRDLQAAKRLLEAR
jgi:hypothetical protein